MYETYIIARRSGIREGLDRPRFAPARQASWVTPAAVEAMGILHGANSQYFYTVVAITALTLVVYDSYGEPRGLDVGPSVAACIPV